MAGAKAGLLYLSTRGAKRGALLRYNLFRALAVGDAGAAAARAEAKALNKIFMPEINAVAANS